MHRNKEDKTKSVYANTRKDLRTIDSILAARKNRDYDKPEYKDKFIYNAF